VREASRSSWYRSRTGTRCGIAIAGAIVLLGVAGCGRWSGDTVPGASPGIVHNGWPAAAQSLVCGLVEFDQVASTLGLRFTVAGGARVGDTATCALTQAGAPYPELTMSVTPTMADSLIFTFSVAPTGSTKVSGLGQAAYQLIFGPDVSPSTSSPTAAATTGPAGTGVEVGWLSERGDLDLLRYTVSPGTSPATLAAAAPRLVSLAQQIDPMT
jgi:hypothetical protein